MGCRSARAIPPRHVATLTPTSSLPLLSSLSVDLLSYNTLRLLLVFRFAVLVFFFSLHLSRLISPVHRILQRCYSHFFLLLWLYSHDMSSLSLIIYATILNFPPCRTPAIRRRPFSYLFPPFFHIPFVLVHLYTCTPFLLALAHAHTCT